MTTEVEYLFWINKASMDMLKANEEVQILDCTYKTNRHGMPLAVLTGVTLLNICFYSDLCFLKDETARSYEWLFRTILMLFKHLDIPLPLVWLTDGDPQIPTDLHAVIPSATHALCTWHIENNVSTNCKKFFPTNEAWIVFFGNKAGGEDERTLGEFHRLLYAISEQNLNLS